MDQNNINIQKRKWEQISEKERYKIEKLSVLDQKGVLKNLKTSLKIRAPVQR